VTVLLDGNVLVALVVAEHVHHDAVAEWFTEDDRPFATTPSTQGTLLRFLLRAGVRARDGATVLDGVTSHERHVFWPDEAPYSIRMLRGVVGHRMVTDAYLAERARDQGGRLATLDRGMAAAHEDVAELIVEVSTTVSAHTPGGLSP
jgi:toxin-antitoxin system PIN domain toxin